jgi:phosphate:Na+ symporter
MREFLAGTGIFLLGMKLMETSLMSGSAGAMKRLLKQFTDTTRKSVLTGTILSSITQSSTIVSVMTVTFVGAWVITLVSAIGIIIGANIWSTLLGLVMGWAVAGSFKISTFAIPMIGIGWLGELFWKKRKRFHTISTIIMGFGLIFYGIGMLKWVVSDYSLTHTGMLHALDMFGLPWYFIIGVILTALMHSSDAMLIIALALLSQGVINLPASIAIVIGANLGTTVSVIEWSIGGTPEQKQVALSHVLFNAISALIWLPLVGLSIKALHYFFVFPAGNVMALAVYDIAYNVIGAIVFFPFIRHFARLLQYLIREKSGDYILHTLHTDAHNTKKILHSLTLDTIMMLKKIYKFNVHQCGIDQKTLLQRSVSLEAKAQTLYTLDAAHLDADYLTLTTIEEALISYEIHKFGKHDGTFQEEWFERVFEAIERMMYAAKTLKDIKWDIDALHATGKSIIEWHLYDIRYAVVTFYNEISYIIAEEDSKKHYKNLIENYTKLHNAHQRFFATLGNDAASAQLHRSDIASLLHVLQAVIRSHKAMLHVIEVMYFPDSIHRTNHTLTAE